MKPRVAISSCLIGQEVRFDGGHKHNRYITQTLADYFDLVPFCPEVAIGLGIPRPSIRLVDVDGEIRARGSRDIDKDFTAALDEYAGQVVDQLDGVSGYILKKDSPSCGMERVRVYREEGRQPDRKGVGIHARRVMAALPHLPVEEEGRLMDPGLRENFVERVFVFHRWQTEMTDGATPARLVSFHTRHKFLIQSHHEASYRELGQIVAQAGTGDTAEKSAKYLDLLMDALKHLATPGKHANVLMHIMGFFKEHMTPEEKSELLGLIDDHRLGLVPLIVPITLINHFRRRYSSVYIDEQVYLEPHPRELMLRNLV